MYVNTEIRTISPAVYLTGIDGATLCDACSVYIDQEIIELCGTMEVTVLMDRNNYCFRHPPAAARTLLCVAAEHQATWPVVP
jgi:hypothetical protein